MMDIEVYGGVEFEGVIVGGGFWVIEYHIDFYMDLVDEYYQGIGIFHVIGDLVQGLVHQVGLQVYVGIVYFVFDFCLGYQGCYGIHDYYVYGVGMYQYVGDFQCLFVGVGLGYDQVIYVDIQFFCVVWVQCVFCIYEGIGGVFFSVLG